MSRLIPPSKCRFKALRELFFAQTNGNETEGTSVEIEIEEHAGCELVWILGSYYAVLERVPRRSIGSVNATDWSSRRIRGLSDWEQILGRDILA